MSFDVQEGEFFGLLGPNGAGKTTLISTLAGLSRPTQGRVLVHGHDVQTDYAAARRLLGVVPQELVFDPFFNVREMLRIQSGYFGVKNNDAWVDELLEGLGLTDKANANMRQLSGGMKKRVAIARALAMEPAVLLCDEITSALDPELVGEVLRVVESLAADGMTLLMVTHEMNFARKVANRVVFMHQGLVHEMGTPDALFSNPQTPELKQFLSALKK